MKISKKFLIGFAAFIILTVILSGCTGNNGDTDTIFINKTGNKPSYNFAKTADRYQFTYKKSVLNLSRKKFDDYNLTEQHLRKFCDKMEEVYTLYSDFFMVHDLPEVFTYNSVTREYMESAGVFVDAYSVGEENATYYVEGWLENYIKNINKGLPSIVTHEVGHLYTYCKLHGGSLYNSSKYVWDCEVFAVIATEYLLSLPDFELLNASGGKYSSVTTTQKKMMKEDGYDEWVKNYQAFIHYKIAVINEKYGYDILHEVFEEMIERESDLNITEIFDLFFGIYSEKTGVNLKDEYFTQEELDTIYENIGQNPEPPVY